MIFLFLLLLYFETTRVLLDFADLPTSKYCFWTNTMYVYAFYLVCLINASENFIKR